MKIPDSKDPAESLSLMFKQVVGTLFVSRQQKESFWKNIRGGTPLEALGLQEFFEAG